MAMLKISLLRQMVIAVLMVQGVMAQSAENLVGHERKTSEISRDKQDRSFVLTNVCRIVENASSYDLKCEIHAELNKVRTELHLENQKAINSICKECDKKYRDGITMLNEDAEKWFERMKSVLDEARDTNGKMIAWIVAVLGTIVAAVAGFGSYYGVIVPRREEKNRGKEFEELRGKLTERTDEYSKLNRSLQQWMTDYDELKRSFVGQKAGYNELLNELRLQKELQKNSVDELQKALDEAIRKNESSVQWLNGKNEYDMADIKFEEYKRDPTRTWLAAAVIKACSWALYHFFANKDAGWVQLTIWRMENAASTPIWRANKKEIKSQLKNREWDVRLADIVSLLKSQKDDGTGNDYIGWFEKIYAEYGRPKT